MDSDVPTDDSDQQRSYSPLVRRLAEEFDVDLDAIRGTGPGGRVTRADVQQAAFGPNLDHDLPATTTETATDTSDDTVSAPEGAGMADDATDSAVDGAADSEGTPENVELDQPAETAAGASTGDDDAPDKAADTADDEPASDEPASAETAPGEPTADGADTATGDGDDELEPTTGPEPATDDEAAKAAASADASDEPAAKEPAPATTAEAKAAEDDDTVIETEPAAAESDPIEIELPLDMEEVEVIITEPITYSLQAEIQADALLRVQDRLRRYREQPVPLSALVVRLLAPSLLESSVLNASAVDDYEPSESITITVQLIADERLVELEQVESATLSELAEAVAYGGAESATDPTFAVSCFAGTAVTASVPTLDDTAAALAIGQPRDGLRMVNGVAQPATTITLGLTCADHIDPVVAARFLSDVSAALEEPILVFAD